ncbi:sulfotransferase domain-containing protein [Phenylobacterium sp.]|uniref:sulfotransferase domain-containing protein n=1 Tax=Phenylobacterium sp. TaxID=1871053 RepID=UPI00289CE71E|nr:sulfotransferase domain-containing protein [Phenylobacterium sp.]
MNFIIAGVQKAGTTALFDYLSDIPAYALSATKEVHFFDDESVDWAAPDYEPYHAQFDWTGEAIRGEATPIYLYWPRCLERIAAYNSDVRLIVMLRDPVERAWSHWRMETSRGAEMQPFSWCIRQGRRRLFDAEPWGAHREFSYVERGFYGEQIERLYGLFPREQVLLLQADDLRRDPNTALGRVSDFLGAPAPAPVEHRNVHVGQDVGGALAGEDVSYLREIYAEDMARLARLTGVSFW